MVIDTRFFYPYEDSELVPMLIVLSEVKWSHANLVNMLSTPKTLLKKKVFFFGPKKLLRGRLHFRRTHNNIFVTFTDLFNRVITTMSGGRCFQGNKRQKKAPQVLEPIVARLLPSFKQHQLQSFEIWLKSRFSWHVQILLKELSLRNFAVLSIVDKRVVAHNGVRGRKIRRI